MLKETAQYFEQYTEDADVAKTALARITRESLMAWISLYGDLPTQLQSEITPPAPNILQEKLLAEHKYLMDVEPLPENYRPGKQLPYQIIRASRTGYMGVTSGRKIWRAVDLATVEALTLRNAGYGIRFFENSPDGSYGNRPDLTIVTVVDSVTKNKIDQIMQAKKEYAQLYDLNEMIEDYTFEKCMRIWNDGLRNLLNDHPALKP